MKYSMRWRHLHKGNPFRSVAFIFPMLVVPERITGVEKDCWGEGITLLYVCRLCNVQIFSYKFVCAISRILYNVYKCSLSFVIPLMINSDSSGCGNIYGLIQWYKSCIEISKGGQNGKKLILQVNPLLVIFICYSES